MEEIVIYLAGKIQKAHEDPNETYWSERDQTVLRDAFLPSRARLLDPAVRSDDLSDQHSVFGRDMTQVFVADAVFCLRKPGRRRKAQKDRPSCSSVPIIDR